MSWQHDINTLNAQREVLRQHQTILGYTTSATRKAIAEMREPSGLGTEVDATLRERANECEQALEAVLDYYNS